MSIAQDDLEQVEERENIFWQKKTFLATYSYSHSDSYPHRNDAKKQKKILPKERKVAKNSGSRQKLGGNKVKNAFSAQLDASGLFYFN